MPEQERKSAKPDTFEVSFGDCGKEPVRLPEGASLSEHLTVQNSPILFGCRTGICGTCISTVEARAPLPPPEKDEAELLAILAPGNPKARLACQLPLRADIAIAPLKT